MTLQNAMKRIALALVASVGLAHAATQEDVVDPPKSLTLENVPPIPASIAQALRPYAEFRPHALFAWHPRERRMLVSRRLEATNQVHLLAEPGARPEALTDFADAISNAAFPPSSQGDWFVFIKGEGGNEVFRIHRFDMATRASTPISPAGERAGSASFNRKGDRLVYTTATIDRNNPDRTARTTVHVVDPLKPEGARMLARFEGGTWTGWRFSEDGRQLAFVEYISVNESHLWLMDVASGKRRRVTTPGKTEPVWYGSPRFARDGKGLFALSDRDSEYRRLVYIPLGSGKERVISGHLRFNVDAYDIAFEAGRIAVTTNENGAHGLRFFDLKTLKELPRPPLVDGVIGGLEWREGSSEVGFHLTTARSSGDVFSYDLKANRLHRWTNGNNPELNTSQFAEPRLIRWKSFDGLDITGFHYHPPARFAGKRPVIVNIHGGPESQARPTFIGRNNYFVNEMGVALIYPNVRGSSGFGKTFLKLDNGKRREDSVKDIGALLDWIRSQPDLDADRVIVTGGSYGGYMTLATAVHYGDRIAGAVSSVGISNFVTFLERTESYRRDNRRAEYGDERDPAMRAYLESISPLTHAAKISKPLFVVQGRNDPRVPYTESEQIVASLKQRGTPVWFMMAADEGHGFAKKHNADYYFYAMVEFARQTILK